MHVFRLIAYVLPHNCSPNKDGDEEQDMLTDERILAPGLTIVEEEGSINAGDLGGGTPVPNGMNITR